MVTFDECTKCNHELDCWFQEAGTVSSSSITVPMTGWLRYFGDDQSREVALLT